MARRIRREHHSQKVGQAEWTIFESVAPGPHQADPERQAFYEDSELTIAIQSQGEGIWRLIVGATAWEPAFENETRGLSLYLVPLTNGVGRIRLILQDPTRKEAARIERPILRRKLGSDEDLAELERHWVQARIPLKDFTPHRTPYSGMQAVPAEDQADPVQWVHGIRSQVKSLTRSARSIYQKPHHNVSVEAQHRPVRSIRRHQTSSILHALQGRRLVYLPHPRWGPDPEARRLAATHAKRIERMLERVREAFHDHNRDKNHLDPSLDRAFLKLEKTLHQLQAQGKHNSNPKRPRPRQALLHDPRYRHLEQASRLTRRDRQFHEGEIESLRPGTDRLYEEWCAGVLVEELSPPETRLHYQRELAKPGTREIRIERPGNTLTVCVQHEMGLEGAPELGTHKPDFLIRLEDEQKVVILDAKYRTDPKEPLRPPHDAVNELHRYRDVYRLANPDSKHKQIWAAVLYPALGEWRQTALFEQACLEKYRIGAVPLTPSTRLPVKEYLDAIGLGVSH